MTAFLAPFAAIEACINAGTRALLANAVALYTPTAGATQREQGVIFDAQYAAEFDDLVQGYAPALQCLEQDVADMQPDARFVIRGVTYAVTEAKPDGTGWLVLRLRVAQSEGTAP